MTAKIIAVAGLMIAGTLAVAAPPKPVEACMQTCAVEFRAERNIQEATFKQALSGVTEQVQSCLSEAAAPTESFVCLRQGRAQTANLELDFRREMAKVSTDLNSCAQQCAPKVDVKTATPTP